MCNTVGLAVLHFVHGLVRTLLVGDLSNLRYAAHGHARGGRVLSADEAGGSGWPYQVAGNNHPRDVGHKRLLCLVSGLASDIVQEEAQWN